MTQITPTVTLSVYVASAWVDISADWLAEGNLFASWGMADNRHITRVASTGEITFLLNNASGKYSPSLAGAMTGFVKGARVRLDIVYDGTTKRLHGRIADLDIDAGTTRNRRTRVTVLDWMEQAATYPIVNPGVQTDKRGDEVLTSTVALMPTAPLATSYDTGVNTFPTVFDVNTRKTTARDECVKIALSEMGYIYLKKDATNGETLVFEGAHYRHGLRAPKTFTSSGGTVSASFNDTMYDMDTAYGRHTINYLTINAFPRKIDTSPVVLFNLDTEIQLWPGEPYELKGYYSDPNGGASVNGTGMIDPEDTTDYLMNVFKDGSSTDLTAYVNVVSGYGSDGFTHTLTNTHDTIAGWITFFQCRGYGIYTYNPIEYVAKNQTSYEAYGYQNETINQRYQNTLDFGGEQGESIVGLDKTPRSVLNSVSFFANSSALLMNAFLNIDVGDVVEIKESQTGIDGWYYVQGIEFSILPGRIIYFTWKVKEFFSLKSGLSLITADFGSSGTSSINCGLMPHIDNLSQRSDSFWIYLNALPAGGGQYSNVFGCAGYFTAINSDGYLFLEIIRTVLQGVWVGSAYPMSTGQWYHVVVTIDNNSTANDPIFYIDGSSRALSEISTPSGSLANQAGSFKKFGYQDYALYDVMGAIKDYRVYNRILSSGEVSTLNSEGPGGTGVSSTGLLFQSPCVRTRDIDYYTAHTMTVNDRVIDNVYNVIGTPNGTIVTDRIDTTETIIQPSNSDNYLNNNFPTSNGGTQPNIYVGNYSGGFTFRTLIKWDLSGITPTDVCLSASISLWIYEDSANQNSTWSVYRLLRNWGEITSTWNKYDGTNDWTTAGAIGAGDVDPTPLGTLSVANNKAVGEWQITLDPTEFQKMYDGTYTNYGFLIKSDEPSTSAWNIRSREYATAGETPKLTIITHP